MEIIQPFLLSLLAGSATGLGGLVILVFNRIEERIMGFLMGFASGVMLVVAFINLLGEAQTLLTSLEVIVSFALGTLLMMIIDLTLPHIESGRWEYGVVNPRLFKSGIIIAIGMSLHNFPEGIVVSAGYSHTPRLGIYIAIMIMLHNIPEGIATAGPLSLSGTERKKTFLFSLASGMTEPLVALLGSMLLVTLGGGDMIIGYGINIASGVMTYITVDELIPVAHEYCIKRGKHMVSIGLLFSLILAQSISIFLGL